MSDDPERRLARPSYGRSFVQSFVASSNDSTKCFIAAVCAKPFTTYSERYFSTKRMNDFTLHITIAGKESCQQLAEKHKLFERHSIRLKQSITQDFIKRNGSQSNNMLSHSTLTMMPSTRLNAVPCELGKRKTC